MPVQTISTMPCRLFGVGSSELTQIHRVRASRRPGSNALPACPCNDGTSQRIHSNLVFVLRLGGVHGDASLPLGGIVDGILTAVGEHEPPIHIIFHEGGSGDFSHAGVVCWDAGANRHLEWLVLVRLGVLLEYCSETSFSAGIIVSGAQCKCDK